MSSNVPGTPLVPDAEQRVLAQRGGRSPARLAAHALRPGSLGRYGVIGMSGVAVDALLFVVLTAGGLVPVAATVLSTCAAIVNNYVLHARFNFRTRLNIVHIRRFVTVSLCGLVLAALSLQFLIEVVGSTPLAAKLTSLPLVLLAQYGANTYWSFRD